MESFPKRCIRIEKYVENRPSNKSAFSYFREVFLIPMVVQPISRLGTQKDTAIDYWKSHGNLQPQY